MANDSSNGKPVYRGAERRHFPRRTLADRRKEIRWEPNNPNRRENPGRRVSDQLGMLGSKR